MATIVVVYGIVLVTPAASAIPIGTTVSWQEHSKNDLRAWPQMLLKGGRNFKIDPQHLSPELCARQRNVQNRSDPRGCLVLNHDTVIPLLKERPDYNTTADVLAFVSDPEYASFFRASTGAEPFLIALCFKNSPPPCGNGLASAHWRSLVDDFFIQARSAIATHGLQLAFVLDGDAAGTPICGCLKDRWRPWPATFIPGGGQQPSDCMSAAFYSNDRTRGFDRFQVLNEPSAKFGSAVALRYGKFVNSSFNYQLYEPKDQLEIEQRVGSYTEAGLEHSPGLRIAINVDSSMLQVYAAGANGTKGFGGWSQLVARAAARPKVVVTPCGNQTLILTVYVDTRANLGALRYSIKRFSGGPGSAIELITPADGVPFPPLADGETPREIDSLVAATAPDGRPIIWMGRSDGRLNALELVGGDQLRPVPGLNASLVTSSGEGFSTAAPSDCPPGATILATSVALCAVQLAATATALELRLWQLQADDHGSPALISTRTLLRPAAALTNLTGSVVALGGGTAAAAWATRGEVYMTTANFTAEGKRGSDSGYSIAAVAVGAVPDLAYLPFGTDAGGDHEGVLMLVHGEGFCQNNEAQNKAASVSVCDQRARSTPSVLVASYGLRTDFEDALQAGRPMNACERRVMHGAFDRGARPSVALFPAPTPSRPHGWGVAVVHEGAEASPIDPGMCGAAHPSPGNIVLAGWTTAAIEDVGR